MPEFLHKGCGGDVMFIETSVVTDSYPIKLDEEGNFRPDHEYSNASYYGDVVGLYLECRICGDEVDEENVERID